jgi:ubiquinone/menaquinone biosynthesis C-methylase UbiE
VEAHPVFARFWSHISSRVAPAARRQELLAGLSGRGVELGAGDGLNFRHYPRGVGSVVAVEPEPHLRGLAVRAAEAAGVSITVVDGDAEAIPLDDGECDFAVASLVLCSVPNQAAALSELRRVLAPGGELRFFEHVLHRNSVMRRVQNGLDDSGVWPHLGGGCHLARDTVAAIRAGGFEVAVLRTYTRHGIPFVLGSAR